MNLTFFKTDIELFRAEIRKVWGFPILELAVGLIALISISSVQTVQQIVIQPDFQATFVSDIAESLSSVLNQQILFLGLLCGILISLSFARDYEQGLIQTLLSSPVSRFSIFIVKFFAVVLPLALLAWGINSLVIFLNYYSDATATLTILGLMGEALPFMLLMFMFCGGLATLVALTIRKTIPSALAIMAITFFAWFITQLKAEAIGSLAEYLVLTPFKAPLISLGRILGTQYLPMTLEATLPAWNFIVLAIVYALMFLIPMYLYFTRRFEVRE
ncbi:MAG: ABC transporter permease [Candidatus Bathyarchaeota archaeon]|nr:ABC transporter permease [Candidatus Bathyarchaeota archaeon]